MGILDNAGAAIDQGKEKIAEAARAEAAELQQKAEAIGNRPKPLKYVIGAFVAGFLLGVLLTIAAFGGIKGYELPARGPVAENAR